MDITVERINYQEDYTEGKMYIDGEYFCDTLEDKDRGLDDTMSVKDITKIKKHGVTAIPKGKYRVILSYSEKFKKILPEILCVKCFSGVRIHSLNFASQSLGCVGIGYKSEDGIIRGGSKLQPQLIETIKKAIESKNEVTITIM